MNKQNPHTVQTMTQGRESEAQRLVTVARPLRSLNHGLRQPRSLSFGFAPLRFCLNLLLTVGFVALCCAPIFSQEAEDTIRIKTRVVFLDALVKDKRTNLPVNNLPIDTFQVLDNGKPRPISYFTREGQARKPLALVLILDLREDGAGRFLKNADVLKSMENELAKLPQGDEVAIMAMNTGEDEKRYWLTPFTNERSKIAAALEVVQLLSQSDEGATPEQVLAKQNKIRTAAEPIEIVTVEPAPTVDQATQGASGSPNASEAVSVEVSKGKNGSVVTRTVKKDGSVDVKRVNKKGDVTVEFNDIYDMAAAMRDAARRGQRVRPNSQLSVVWVSDGIAPIFYEDRDASEQILIRDNIIFNSLTVDLRTLFKFLMPIGKPVAGWMGLSLYGSAKYLAERSGGEAVKVGRVKDYGAGLARIIGNLTARYSLGFALAEDEMDDGNMHALEVKVNAKDEKGKSRKLLVSSRQGYFMSSVGPKNTAARAQ